MSHPNDSLLSVPTGWLFTSVLVHVSYIHTVFSCRSHASTLKTEAVHTSETMSTATI